MTLSPCSNSISVIEYFSSSFPPDSLSPSLPPTTSSFDVGIIAFHLFAIHFRHARRQTEVEGHSCVMLLSRDHCSAPLPPSLFVVFFYNYSNYSNYKVHCFVLFIYLFIYYVFIFYSFHIGDTPVQILLHNPNFRMRTHVLCACVRESVIQDFSPFFSLSLTAIRQNFVHISSLSATHFITICNTFPRSQPSFL